MTYDPNLELKHNTSHVSTGGETRPDTSRYVLTIEEASQLFAEAGVPRSPRTVSRYCQHDDLDCLHVDTEKNFKFLIDRNSVEKRIKELQQVALHVSKSLQDKSRHVEPTIETQPDMSRYDKHESETAQPREDDREVRERVEELEYENFQLKIDKQARERIITQMSEERKDFFNQVQDMSFRLGEATAKLKQLEAPRSEPQSSHVQTADETAQREAVVIENAPVQAAEPNTASAMTSEPTPAPAIPEKKGNFLSRLFNSQ